MLLVLNVTLDKVPRILAAEETVKLPAVKFGGQKNGGAREGSERTCLILKYGTDGCTELVWPILIRLYIQQFVLGSGIFYNLLQLVFELFR